ncbi:MAG: hydroxymethylbilane synthase [Chloroflexi bacterium]|nr:hydroxymethylbilane synthase [Chloroflexota bacterium]
MKLGRIAIGSRGSALALVQARLVQAAFEREGRPTRLVIIETDGDRRHTDTAWGEGAFVAAIEEALLDGRVDVAAHSAKDVPTNLDARLRIAAYLPRADPRDALVVRLGASARCLADLPTGSRVGTDSPRRTGYVRALRPDLDIHPLHGNVDTRLRRLDDGETDALILACAGLDRLGLHERIAERLDPELVPPAPGQGAIAIQIRSDDARLVSLAAAIDDVRTHQAAETERLFLTASGGGCRSPIGALATIVGDDLALLGGHTEPDGSHTVFGHRRGPRNSAATMARDLATQLGRDRSRLAASSLGVLGRPTTAAAPPAATPPRARVLVGRPAAQSGELAAALTQAGLEPVVVPAIEVAIDPPHGALDRHAGLLDSYRWVVVTSANGARAILKAAERVLTELAAPSWAVVGAASGAALTREGITVHFQPSRASGRALATELPIQPGDRVLVVRGDLADGRVAAGLRERGAIVDDVIGYRSREAPASSRPLLRAAVEAAKLDAVVFSSGSTVRGFVALAHAEALDLSSVPAVCIGPETAKAASLAGFRILAVASTPSATAIASIAAGALAAQTREDP